MARFLPLLLVARLSAASLAVLWGMVPSAPPAAAAIPMIEPKTPRALTDDDLAEIIDFVVGNAVFALYHQAGEMMMDRYGAVPKGVGKAERAADLFAITTLLDPRSGTGDQTLVDALDSWKLAAQPRVDVTASDEATRDPHALDEARARELGCDLVGADGQSFSDIADALGFDEAKRRLCAASWKRGRAAWAAALKPFAAKGKSDTAYSVAYDEAAEADAAAATILKDNNVLEEVAGRLADRLALKSPPLIRATNCGSPTTRYDSAKNELIFCYERATADARLILDDIEHRN